MSNYEEIEKGFANRFQEFIQSLQIINDSIQQFKNGKIHQIIPIYGQLRALLTEKSKKNAPLMFEIANGVNASLDFYCMPDVDDFPNVSREGLLLDITGFPLSIKKELPKQICISLQDFLNHEMVFFDNKKYKVSEIISFFANKSGGAHYASKLPKDFAQLLSFGLNGQPILVNSLLQIAEIVYKIGIKIVQKLSNFEIYILAFVPNQTLQEPAYIVDNFYPEGNMRSFIRIEPNMRLTFGAIGFEGSYTLLTVKSLIDWDKIHLFNFTLMIDEFMESHLSIYIDGELIEKSKVPFPIFIYNDSLLYETFINRSFDNETSGLNFGLCQMLGYSTEVPFKGRANLFLYFDEKLGKEELRCIYFTKGQYGYAKSGTNNLVTTNSPVMWDIGKLKQGTYPKNVNN